MQNIAIWSEAFSPGGTIPKKYTCDGSDFSPPLSFSGIPPNTRSIALIMEDPDAPMGTFVHWIIYNIPPYITELPEAFPKGSIIEDTIFQGITSFGRFGYGGPCPPRGETHRYFFKIYALDIERLLLPPRAYKEDVERSITNHILVKGELMGLYGR